MKERTGGEGWGGGEGWDGVKLVIRKNDLGRVRGRLKEGHGRLSHIDGGEYLISPLWLVEIISGKVLMRLEKMETRKR